METVYTYGHKKRRTSGHTERPRRQDTRKKKRFVKYSCNHTVRTGIPTPLSRIGNGTVETTWGLICTDDRSWQGVGCPTPQKIPEERRSDRAVSVLWGRTPSLINQSNSRNFKSLYPCLRTSFFYSKVKVPILKRLWSEPTFFTV